MATRVGIYCRISDDVEGQGLGVERQEKDGRRICADRGWQVADLYVDPSISAYNRRVIRPEFERLLTDLTEARIDGIVVYDLDRFARQPRDLERAIDVYEGRAGLVFASAQGDIELGRSDGLLQARMLVAFANKSSADTSRRVTRKALEMAERGVPVGQRAFGWKDDKRTIDPTEAEILRGVIEDVLAGQSLGRMTDELNGRGVKTARGAQWSRQGLRQLLLSPRLCGWRTYRGTILRDTEGQPVAGQWEPLLTPEEWERLRSWIAPANRIKSERPGGRRYVLSGLIRCGSCGSKMRGNRKGEGRCHSWQCPPPNQGGCGKTAVSGRADAMIEQLVLERLSTLTAERAPSKFPGAKTLTEKAGRLSDLMDAFTRGDLSASVVFPAVRSLEAEIEELRVDQRAWDARNRQASSTTVLEAWPDLSVDQRRTVVATVIDAVLVRPAEHRGGQFDPTRLEAVWA
jgi:DNA invertase Pin-like site-specific DNA recombinase